jgi:hypothetical protein
MTYLNQFDWKAGFFYFVSCALKRGKVGLLFSMGGLNYYYYYVGGAALIIIIIMLAGRP